MNKLFEIPTLITLSGTPVDAKTPFTELALSAGGNDCGTGSGTGNNCGSGSGAANRDFLAP